VIGATGWNVGLALGIVAVLVALSGHGYWTCRS
jgi:hypothetical protein